MKSYRYPGSRPFNSQEQNLFFGRNTHIRELKKTIQLNKITVLYGPSGLGKSSLIQAGLVPQVQEKYVIIPVRFNNYINKLSLDPLSTFERRIDELPLDLSVFDKIESEKISIWQKLKSIQQSIGLERKILIVFDQFEELFTYPKGIDEFSLTLSDLLSSKMPKVFSEKLEQLIEDDPYALTDEDWDSLSHSLDLRILISIRSDRMSLLDRISQQISTILSNRYELSPLSEVHAREAIMLPAQMGGKQFRSPAFAYEESALEKLITYLSKNHTEPIESFQLQILCQHIEENLAHFGETPSEAESLWIVKADKLPKLEVISQNYYEEQLGKIEPETARRKAKLLIEEGLILEEEERRLSLDEGHIRTLYEIDGDLLDKLVATHIVRREPNSLGGFSYELSHDTLVAPILATKKFRETKERELLQQQAAEERVRAAQAEKEAKLRQRLRQTSWIALIAIAILSAIFGGSFYVQYQKSLIVNQKLKEYNENLRDAYASLSQFVRVDTTAKGDSLGMVVVVQSRRALEIIKGYNRNIAIYDSLTRDLQAALDDRSMDRAAMIERIEIAKQQIDGYETRFINLVKKSSLDALMLLEDADSAFQQKDYVRALQLYEKAEKLDPGNEFAIEGIKVCKQKQQEGIIAGLLEEAMRLIEVKKEQEAREKIDEILALNGTHEKALALLEKLKEEEKQMSDTRIATLFDDNPGISRGADDPVARSPKPKNPNTEIDSSFIFTEVLNPEVPKRQSATKAEQAYLEELRRWIQLGDTRFADEDFLYAQKGYERVLTSDTTIFSSATPLGLLEEQTQLFTFAKERYDLCEQNILNYNKSKAIGLFQEAKDMATFLHHQARYKNAIEHWEVSGKVATYLARKFDYEAAIQSLPDIKTKLNEAHAFSLNLEARRLKKNNKWKAAIVKLTTAEKFDAGYGNRKMRLAIIRSLDSLLEIADNNLKTGNDYIKKSGFKLKFGEGLAIVKKSYQNIESKYKSYKHAAKKIEEIDELMLSGYDDLAHNAYFKENWQIARRHFMTMRKIAPRDERTKAIAKLLLEKANGLKEVGDIAYGQAEYISAGEIYKQVLEINPSDKHVKGMMQNLKEKADLLLDPLLETLYQLYLAKDTANIELREQEIASYKGINSSIARRRTEVGNRLMAQVSKLYTNGKLEEAKKFYQSILPLNPEVKHIRSHISQWMDGIVESFKVGKRPQARTAFQEINEFAAFSDRYNGKAGLKSYVFIQSGNTFNELLNYSIKLYEERDFPQAEATYYYAIKLFIRLDSIDRRSSMKPGYAKLLALPKDQQNVAIFDLINEEVDISKHINRQYIAKIHPFYQRLWDNEAKLSATRSWNASKVSYEAIMKIKPDKFKYSSYFLYLNFEEENPFPYLKADAHYQGEKWTDAREAYKNLCRNKLRAGEKDDGKKKKNRNKEEKPPPSFDEMYNSRDFEALRKRISKLPINGSVRNYYRDTILERLKVLRNK